MFVFVICACNAKLIGKVEINISGLGKNMCPYNKIYDKYDNNIILKQKPITVNVPIGVKQDFNSSAKSRSEP